MCVCGGGGSETEREVTLTLCVQDSLTRTMGEFAGVLPDYHKPDIMTLITSYMDSVGGGAGGGASGREVKRQLSSKISSSGRYIHTTYLITGHINQDTLPNSVLMKALCTIYTHICLYLSCTVLCCEHH